MPEPMLHDVYLASVLLGLVVPFAGVAFFTRRSHQPAVGRQESQVVWCPHHQRHTVVVVECTRDDLTSHLVVGCSLGLGAECRGGCHILPAAEPGTDAQPGYDSQAAAVQ
jgi:hypothetical protein